jgi:hypothetical protein
MKKITIRIYGQKFQFQGTDAEVDRFVEASRAHCSRLDAIDRAKHVLCDSDQVIQDAGLRGIIVEDVEPVAA